MAKEKKKVKSRKRAVVNVALSKTRQKPKSVEIQLADLIEKHRAAAQRNMLLRLQVATLLDLYNALARRTNGALNALAAIKAATDGVDLREEKIHNTGAEELIRQTGEKFETRQQRYETTGLNFRADTPDEED